MKHTRLALLFLVASAIWLPVLHVFYALDEADRKALGAKLAARQTAAVAEAAHGSVAQMRAVNPEWDFMQRTYTVLALANRALSLPAERTRNLAAIDAMVDATLAATSQHGDEHFMLPYARGGRFADREARSLFIDGEIVAMIAARDLVEPRASTRSEALAPVKRIVPPFLGRIRRSASLPNRKPPKQTTRQLCSK